jgi:hypothetical protein
MSRLREERSRQRPFKVLPLLCMEGLRQNAKITKKTTSAQIEILRCCVLNSQEILFNVY